MGYGRPQPQVQAHPADHPQTDGSSALARVVKIGERRTAWDPDNPLGLLQEAAQLKEGDRPAAVVRAIERMVHGGMDAAAEEQARAYVTREKLITAARYDSVVRAERKKAGGEAKNKLAAGIETSAYYVTGGCTYWDRPTPNGPVPVMLATFTAEIAEQVTLDDGTEQTLTWLVRVTAKDGRTGEVRITPDQLGKPQQWTAKAVGVSALVMPGLAVADHLRVAVHSGSRDPSQKIVYTHTGWRRIDGRQAYLTSSGALGSDGLDEAVTVDLGPLDGFALPGVPDVPGSAKESLALADIAPDRVMLPLLAAVYRAPLPLPPDCAVWLFGRSGTFKTAVTALMQQHYGSSMDAHRLPGNWTSTANALEMQAYTLDGALYVVDDYSPDSTKTDAQRRSAAADRLVRGSANRAGRARLRPDGTQRPEKPPRAQVLTSAEDIPPGVASMRARAFVAEIVPGDVNLEKLTTAQHAAAAGRLAEAMSGYIRWLATRYDDDAELPAALGRKLRELRDAARAEGHPRHALNIASLALGWHEFLAFAADDGALSIDERDAMWARTWKTLCDVGADQEKYGRDADPVCIYLQALAALITQGRAYLADTHGRPPADAVRWGWQWDDAGEGSFRARGDLLGWVEGDDIYFHPDSAYNAARKFAETAVTLGLSKNAVHKALNERGLLASVRPDHYTVRKRVGEAVKTVLHLTVKTFDSGGEKL
jgi:hypothetical protein